MFNVNTTGMTNLKIRYTFVFLSSLEILADRLNAAVSITPIPLVLNIYMHNNLIVQS
jgi:hypothetical protein